MESNVFGVHGNLEQKQDAVKAVERFMQTDLVPTISGQYDDCSSLRGYTIPLASTKEVNPRLAKGP